MEKNLKITYIQKVVNTLLHLRCCELIVKEILRGGEYEICPKTVEVESTKIYESSAGKKVKFDCFYIYGTKELAHLNNLQ